MCLGSWNNTSHDEHSALSARPVPVYVQQFTAVSCVRAVIISFAKPKLETSNYLCRTAVSRWKIQKTTSGIMACVQGTRTYTAYIAWTLICTGYQVCWGIDWCSLEARIHQYYCTAAVAATAVRDIPGCVSCGVIVKSKHCTIRMKQKKKENGLTLKAAAHTHKLHPSTLE